MKGSSRARWNKGNVGSAIFTNPMKLMECLDKAKSIRITILSALTVFLSLCVFPTRVN